MIVTSMFYTRAEQTKRVGYWCTSRERIRLRPFKIPETNACSFFYPVLMNGFAIIILGFISFGVLHTKVRIYLSAVNQAPITQTEHRLHRRIILCLGNGTFASAVVGNTGLIAIFRLMIITGAITLVTAVLFW